MKPHIGFKLGTVTAKIDWADKLFSLRIQSEISPYTAGQFSKLALYQPNGELSRRAYSIVNHPEDYDASGELEYLIVADLQGELSPMLHQLEVGDSVLVSESAAGFMTLAEIPQSASELWLLSTGTAIGPYLSMLDEPHVAERFERIVLVNATRTQAEQTYSNKIQHYQHLFKGRFNYVPVISRESVPGALSGRIPQLLNSKKLDCTTFHTVFHKRARTERTTFTSQHLRRRVWAVMRDGRHGHLLRIC